MGRDESVIGLNNECEGFALSAHGAWSGFECVRWRCRMIRRWRNSITSRRGSRISGDGGRGGVDGGELTALLL